MTPWVKNKYAPDVCSTHNPLRYQTLKSLFSPGYEKAAERWLPVHTVETILVSVISMLSVRII